MVPVPDPRLQELAAIANPEKIVPATVEFVDIAGLVAGASQGEGLGNQFLAHIREVDAIAHVVRCFDNGDIVHVAGRDRSALRYRDDQHRAWRWPIWRRSRRRWSARRRPRRAADKDVLRKETLFERVKQELQRGSPGARA